jgi:uncharacterized protein (DUF2141 family)
MKLAVICLSMFALSQTPAGGVVKLTIDHARSDKGKVLCSLYSSKEGFPKDPSKAIKTCTADIKTDKAECNFADAPKGTLAISCFHDENGNGKLDTNFLGIPKEGVAMSNNAKGRFGPPSFEDASFAFDGSAKDLTITLQYL